MKVKKEGEIADTLNLIANIYVNFDNHETTIKNRIDEVGYYTR